MNVQPSFKKFKALAKQGNLIPLYTEVLADSVTPVSLLTSYWDKIPYCFLLESVEGGEKLGRYSVLGFSPEALLEETPNGSEYKTAAGKVFMRSDGSALDFLSRHMRCVKPVSVPGLPRFYGGAVGYLSYETVHAIERLPKTNPNPLGWSDAFFMLVNDLFVFDNTQQLLKIVSCVRLDKKTNLKKAYQEGVRRLALNLSLYKSATRNLKAKREKKKFDSRPFVSNVSSEEYRTCVRKAKEYIGKGDIIQVVISRRQEKRTAVNPVDIYRCLRVVNPSPYMFVLKMKGRAIIGSSPEPLVRLENGNALTRPIAGTRPRGRTVEEDIKLEKDLLKDPKERAEHLMLVDLGRNDLGRVCQFGSVEIPKFMVIERYSHVMHIVSEISGKMKPGKDGFDLLKAAFPAGTVSGAPKIRAMEIIDELEKDQRGPYSGALGYFSYSGNMDMAITIRTILWDQGKVSIQTGAGIVADSNPEREYQETENKAAGMKKTIELAESGRLF